jgi:pimeloyl-ACP methyl ester carboxylesterase
MRVFDARTSTHLRLAVYGRLLWLVPSFFVAAVSMAQPSPDTIVVREALGISLPRKTVANVIMNTPLDAWFVSGRMEAPRQGEVVHFADGSQAMWERIFPDANGWFEEAPPTERFVAVTLTRTVAGKLILEGMGHDIVYVNGVPRVGNQYQQKEDRESWEPHFDYSHIPIDLHKGNNLLLFRYTRGRLKVKLYEPAGAVVLNANDLTLPDAIVGKPLDAWGAVVVVNSTREAVKGFSLLCTMAGAGGDLTEIPQVPAVGVRKVGFRIRMGAQSAKGEIPIRLALMTTGGRENAIIDTATVPIRVVNEDETRKETFLSGIDSSVQYYAITPQKRRHSAGSPALFLSLHGAGVEALGQAASYSPKNWGAVVAATNRRPFGFSWEDWGRLDALEVLELVRQKYGFDEGRVYLTGHSMGGHGTWFMGATYPDKFAAIGPSAGWITFQSYRFAGAPEETSAVQKMLRRASSPSDLFGLVDNYRHFGVYILHGDKDDNVPPQQSYMMVERLKPIHKDFVFYEQPGAGHWWDNSPEPGTDCVDWAPMFDFFARHVRAGVDRVRYVEFTTANPGISARDYWLTVDAQERQLALSTARLQLDPGLNQVSGTTVNVTRLAILKGVLDLSAPITVLLDSQKLALRDNLSSDDRFWFERVKGIWSQCKAPAPEMKGERRYGTFKEVFRNNVALVYGTAGSAEENRWAFERARYDAEKLWYQGNGSVDVFADSEFDPATDSGRNVVLYGNSRTHRLWDVLLPGSPVKLKRDRVEVGGENIKGSDLCCIFVRPRPGNGRSSVGVVGGTGIEGMRLSHIVRYLEPGVGLPDLTIFNRDVVKKGDSGILRSGFFGLDWSVESGEFIAGKKK